MANHLNTEEAYIACLVDVQKAQRVATYAVQKRMVPQQEFDKVMRREFVRLCETRIIRGELEASLPGGLRLVERASEAA